MLLAGLLAYGVYLLAIAIPARRGQTIHLAFRNANEISRGAPVRLMGTDIGFVDDIQIEDDHVDITVQTDPNAIQIPSGSMFTILFTGLGGAKSIEVSLPLKPVAEANGKPVYRVQEPISMRDTLNASLDSTQALQKGSENISDFFGKKKPVEELQFNIHQTEEMSGVAVRNTMALNQGLLSMRQDINTYTGMGVDTLQGFNHGADIMDRSTDPQRLRAQALKATQAFHRFNDAFLTEQKMAIRVPLRLTQFNQLNNATSVKILKLNQTIQTMPLPQWLDDLERNQSNMMIMLNQMDGFFAEDHGPALQQTRQNIQNLNRQVIQWDAKVTQLQNRAASKKAPVPKSAPGANQPSPRERSIALGDRFGNTVRQPETAWWHHPANVTPGSIAQPFAPQAQPASRQANGPLEPVVQWVQPVWDALCFLFK